MNYFKIYDHLISRAKDRILEKYVEIHHILPKCLGGTDEDHNLIHLTPEEHYVAHQLLVKMHPYEPKLLFAAHKMTRGRPGNKLYGWLRRKHAAAISVIMSENQAGPKNSQFGTMWITNGVENRKIKKVDSIPEGWHAGKIQLQSRGISSPNKGKKLSEEHRKKLSEAIRAPMSDQTKEKLRILSTGRKLTKKTKKIISEKSSGHNNSQYGLRFRWINNGITNKKFQGDLNELPNGWKIGKI